LKTDRTLWAFTLLSCLVITGCGPSRPETAPVSGLVTYAGKPVPVGQIVFRPENGRPAIAAINANGRYTLTTFKSGDGALLGKHVVTITATRAHDGPPPPKDSQDPPSPKSLLEEVRVGGGGRRAVEWIVPATYSRSETTPLNAEVARGQNTINFNLPVGQNPPVHGAGS
jgi:hypothetical protein